MSQSLCETGTFSLHIQTVTLQTAGGTVRYSHFEQQQQVLLCSSKNSALLRSRYSSRPPAVESLSPPVTSVLLQSTACPL